MRPSSPIVILFLSLLGQSHSAPSSQPPAKPPGAPDPPPGLSPTDVNGTEGVDAYAFHFVGWEGCNTADHPDWSADVEDAWDSLLAIAGAVKDTVQFDEEEAIDFFGVQRKNSDYQTTIRKILEKASTWEKGWAFSWSIHARCDDFLRSNPSCPPGTLKSDYSKCQSRCWQHDKSNPPKWRTRARAYTQNVPNGPSPVATINFCPGFFDMPTCDEQVDKQDKTNPSLSLFDYQCRGAAMIHELFHIDANSESFFNPPDHVIDRRFKMTNEGQTEPTTYYAYSPLYTKVLANWASSKVGYYVATNADNLAQYSLAKWVKTKIQKYPYMPLVTSRPDKTGWAYAVIQHDNGAIGLTSNATTVGDALQDNPIDAYTDYEIDQYGCSDADTDTSCIDDQTNPVIDLTADDTTPTDPSSSSTPAAPSAPPAPSVSCYGLSKDKYIAQADLAANIKDFCQQAAKQGTQDPNSGSLQRSFNPNTPETISISMNWPPGLPGFKLSEPDCEKYMNSISDGCDGNDPKNPMNWKGGGTNQVGKVEYLITPTAQRQNAPTKPGANIQCTGLHFWLNGNGWANVDGGACIKTNLNGCGGSSYNFNYGLGDDGREWTMDAWVAPGQGSCLANALVTCGGPPGLSC